MKLKYPRPVSSSFGRWITLKNEITILPFSGRFVGYDINTDDLVLANGPNIYEVIGWIDMPNDVRVYQMEDEFLSNTSPDFTYKPGDDVFLITSVNTRFLIGVEDMTNVNVGQSYSLTIDSNGNQVLADYSILPKYVVVEKIYPEAKLVIVKLLTTHY